MLMDLKLTEHALHAEHVIKAAKPNWLHVNAMPTFSFEIVTLFVDKFSRYSLREHDHATLLEGLKQLINFHLASEAKVLAANIADGELSRIGWILDPPKHAFGVIAHASNLFNELDRLIGRPVARVG